MENIKENKKSAQTLLKLLHRRLPFPSISTFSEYEKILHGSAADRILGIFEKEAINNQDIEKEVVKEDIRLNARAQILNFILGVLSIGAVYLSIIFKQPAGTIAPTIILITNYTVYFINKRTA